MFSIAALVALPGAAFAAEEPAQVAVRIRETLHPGCPTKPSVFERLRAHLPNVREAHPNEEAIELDVRTELRDKTAFGTLTLTVGDAREERTASSQSCADVLSALSMMAAIVIGEEAPASAKATPAKATPARSRPRPAPEPQPRRERARVHWSLGAGAEINANSGTMLLARWFVEANLPARFEPTLRLGFARSTRDLLASPSGLVSIRWSEVAFAGCVAPVRVSPFRAGPCVDVEVGKIDSSVLDPPPARSYAHLWFTVGASGKVAWQLARPLSIELALGVRVPLSRTELYFEPNENVTYRAPWVVPFVASAFVAHLP